MLIRLQRKNAVNPCVITTQRPVLVPIQKAHKKLQEGSVFYNLLPRYKKLNQQLLD